MNTKFQFLKNPFFGKAFNFRDKIPKYAARHIFRLILCILILLGNSSSAQANEQKDFKYYMNAWNEKRMEASNLLLDAEKEFKSGDEISGCAKQYDAANLGIKATQSLIKAMTINGNLEGINDIKIGLKKWEELRDFC